MSQTLGLLKCYKRLSKFVQLKKKTFKNTIQMWFCVPVYNIKIVFVKSGKTLSRVNTFQCSFYLILCSEDILNTLKVSIFSHKVKISAKKNSFGFVSHRFSVPVGKALCYFSWTTNTVRMSYVILSYMKI